MPIVDGTAARAYYYANTMPIVDGTAARAYYLKGLHDMGQFLIKKHKLGQKCKWLSVIDYSLIDGTAARA